MRLKEMKRRRMLANEKGSFYSEVGEGHDKLLNLNS